MTTTDGIVLNYQSNFYAVSSAGRVYQCFLKGLLKKEGTAVLVGDRVEVDNLDNVNLSGRIVGILPRTNELGRPKVANVTRAMVLASIQNPVLDFEQLDRYLTHVQLAGITPMLCISKADLAESDDTVLTKVFKTYGPLGIPVYATSINHAESVARVFEVIHGQTVVLAGQSGVGKSSLLNAYRPGLSLAVGEVSEKLQRGQHTTRSVSLIALDEDTYVADSPGFSYLKFDTVPPQAVEAVFTDFAPFRDQCRFDNCLHREEEGCAVKAHRDEIAPSRYASYLAFQTEADAYVERLQTTSQKEEYGYKTLKKGKSEELQILRLPGKQRQPSRRTEKQRISEWTEEEDDTLEE